MKTCRNLSHLITPFLCCALATAQADPTSGRIVSLNLDSQKVTTLALRPGFVTSVRLPEPVSSVVLGDPVGFKAEHSDAEPQLVFFKPTAPTPSRTNALITTKNGREVSLTLISQGNSERASPIDYVFKYEHPRSFLIEAGHSSFAIEETKGFDITKLPSSTSQENVATLSGRLLQQQQSALLHWEGKDLRVSVGQMGRNGDNMAVAYSVLNSSQKTIELLPPQIELMDTVKGRHGKAIKAEPIAIKEYQITSRRLAPGARIDGVVIFERPSFKASSERLMLQVAQVEAVDRPVRTTLSFVTPANGGAK